MPVRETRAECYSEEKITERNIKQKNALQKFSRVMKRFFGKITKRGKSGIFYDKLRRNLAPGAKILDIGCGDGSFIKTAKRYFTCTGVEISAHLAALAGKDPDIKVITGNFMSVVFNKDKYDGITMISLLEHLDDPFMALKSCYELLNNGGMLLLKTVNYGSLNRSITAAAWTGFRPPDHMIYFEPSSLRLILQKAGFKKIDIHATPFSDNMYCEAFR